MEGGSVNAIDLEAGLDVSTSDMLVPIQGQTFQHNWQKFQGKFLPNSLRFEKNGWAAGWNVYNFDYNSFKQKVDDKYIGYSQFNTFTQVLSVFNDVADTESLHDIYIVSDALVLSGNVSLDGNVITGKLGNKVYELTWDPVVKDFVNVTNGFTVEKTINQDFSVSAKVIDAESNFDFDFDLLVASSLTGDQITPIKFDSIVGSTYSWGDYTYDGSQLITPEGVRLTVPLTDTNLLAFDYSVSILDEYLTVNFKLLKHYIRFSNVSTFKPMAGDKLTIGGSDSFEFNKYNLQCTSASKNLVPRNQNGVTYNWRLPLWLEFGATVNNQNIHAKLCDNCQNGEVAVTVGTGIRNTVYVKNIYTGNTKNIVLPDRPSNKSYQVINNLDYRFNKIQPEATIEPGEDWQPFKFNLSDKAFYKHSYGFSNIRSISNYSDITKHSLAKAFGTGFNLRGFFNVANTFELNNVFNWADQASIMYTMPNIGGIPSIRLKNEGQVIDSRDENAFVSQYYDKEDYSVFGELKDTAVIITDPETELEAKFIDQLYDSNGNYIGNTYIKVDVWENPNVPFEYIPVMKIKFANFNDTYICYFARPPRGYTGPYVRAPYAYVTVTDPETNESSQVRYDAFYIQDTEQFASYLLGTFNNELEDYKDKVLIARDDYSRTRIVKTYKPKYDFNKDDLDEDFDTLWNLAYPNYQNPHTDFNTSALYTFNRYDGYNDIDLRENQDFSLQYIDPGVYVWRTLAIRFINTFGLIVYDDSEVNNITLNAYVRHHGTDVSNNYNLLYSTFKGRLRLAEQNNQSWWQRWFDIDPGVTFGEYICELPSFFGKSGIDSLIGSGGDASNFEPIEQTVYRVSGYIRLNITKKNETCWLSSANMSLNEGNFNYDNIRLNDGVTQADGLQLDGNIDGLKAAWPVWGNATFKLVYNNITSQNTINDTGDKSPIKIEKLPSDPDLLYWDRNDTLKSMGLFDIDYKGLSITGNDISFALSLNAIDNATLYYAYDSYNDKGEVYVKDFYSPNYNMRSSDNLPAINIQGKTVTRDLPISAIIKFSKQHTYAHNFYSTDYQVLEKGMFIADPLVDYDLDYNTLSCIIDFDGIEVPFIYDADMQTVRTANANIRVIDTDSEDIDIGRIRGISKDRAEFILSMNLMYNNCKVRIPMLSDNYTFAGADGSKYSIEHEGFVIVYDYNKRNVMSHICDKLRTDDIDKGIHVNAQGSIQEKINCILPMIVDGTRNGDNVTFEYNDKLYTVNIVELANASVDNGINVLSTDIRNPEKTYCIGKLRPNGQYQILKQRWNTTTDVESYWWVDPTHTLTLTKDKFILSRNTKKPHDWDGDIFEDIYSIDRADILDITKLRYFCTNTYKSQYQALFVTISEKNARIHLEFHKPRQMLEEAFTVDIQVRQRDIGQQLNDITRQGNIVYFNTYSPLTASMLIAKSVWTASIVDKYLVFGCHFGNNYDQWAFVYDIEFNSIISVVQGYGFVGLHGELTGGMLPTKYFDSSKGFNDTVKPIDSLGIVKDSDTVDDAAEVTNVAEISNVNESVVGTSEQQWYISRELHGVVSHILFDKGNFIPQEVPITNKYSAMYRSPSFGVIGMGDIWPQAQPLSSLLTAGQGDSTVNTVINIIMGVLGMPMIFSLMPRLSNFLYLQQSFGQYAYVHYNSSIDPPEKELGDEKSNNVTLPDTEKENRRESVLLTDSYIFDKQKVTQNLSLELNLWEAGILAVLIPAFSAGIDLTRDHISVNEEQNQTAVDDKGKKFTANFVENTTNLLVTQLSVKSKKDMSATSIVTGIKSLDMFYSTSDRQQINAGPGFVEQQFIADCVAQSSTDLSVKGKVQQMCLFIKFLTDLQYKIEIMVAEAAINALENKADNSENLSVPTWGGEWNIGAAIAIAVSVSADIARSALVVMKAAWEAMSDFIDTLCTQGITSTIFGGVPDRSQPSIEGKHKYGRKNETFMWPCWGITPGSLKYTDETVNAGLKIDWWELQQKVAVYWDGIPVSYVDVRIPNCSDWNFNSAQAKLNSVGNRDLGEPEATNSYMMKVAGTQKGKIPFYQIAPYGSSIQRTLPDDMAKIEGVNKFLPDMAFKNENIGMQEPAFTPSMIQDYIVDKTWDLSQCATYGLQQWMSVKDTKITNCKPSNMVVSDVFCGVATAYSAVEVKRGISKKYMRPYAVTPTTLAFNCTGYNSIFDDKLYHAFDGISYRLVDFVGSPGLGKNRQTFWYAFQRNDRFKRSNKCPPNEIQGNFLSEPVQAVSSIDELYTIVTVAYKKKGVEGGVAGEDKDDLRYAIPVFTDHVNTLPAAVKTLTVMNLDIFQGITGLTTTPDNNLVEYKAPISVDFVIGKQKYRATQEYICSVTTDNAFDQVLDIVPSLGLTFIGATPVEAFFYSKSTRCYYSFSGTTLSKVDMMERFRDIQKGYWDFVNQEVVMPCLMTYKRLNPEVLDTDTETDNVIVPVLSKGSVSGELPPPLTTIFNDRSWYKCVSLPSGFAYQGPNRVIINRNIFVEYMEQSIKDNLGKWKRMDREKYTIKREYPETYDNIMKDVKGIDGWTYNPFILVTSPLGVSENTDCVFEWNITFCWPIEMDLLYGVDNYAVVNISAETMTPGGKVQARPTHVFLTKELFTRSGNYSYYSFRYQSKNGSGNRERLHIWSDQYIAISGLTCEVKTITQRRTEQLTQQQDIQKLKEL